MVMELTFLKSNGSTAFWYAFHIVHGRPKKTFLWFPLLPNAPVMKLYLKMTQKKSKLLTKNPLRAATLKLNIVITIGRSAKNLIWSSLLTWGPYWPKTNMSEQHFARHSAWPYLARPNTWPGQICQIWPNMHIWARGVPEKILQNAVLVLGRLVPPVKSWGE